MIFKMQRRCTIFTFFTVLLICQCSKIEGATQETSETPTIRTDLKNSPIVIQTQVKDYDKPSLQDYEACSDNRENCINGCKNHPAVLKCEADCPVCPILIDHDILVQGVNDTAFKEPSAPSGNATNIIHLRNEIRNVVETTNNISERNENTVHVHQNFTTSGGKFGFGHNDDGPCCQVVRQSKSCTDSRSCRLKRHTVCGKLCVAKVMYAKPVRRCVNADDGGEDCRVAVKYVPYQHDHIRSRCNYSPSWPFVSCPQTMRSHNNRYMLCQRCEGLSYGYVLQNGVPWECQHCFITPTMQNWYGNQMQVYPQFYPSMMQPQPDDIYDNQEGWKLEEIKCRLPDGTISPDCTDNYESIPAAADDLPNEVLNGDGDEVVDDFGDFGENYDSDGDVVRTRRSHSNIFRRSRYSNRN